jgi:phage/plasmid-like protein (TIGR03299 family)
MAHNLMNRNGSTAMFCTGDRDSAWHKLGQRTPGAVSWQEAMKLADLDWPVSKHQLMGALPGTTLAEVAAWGVFRTDDGQFLGAVGERYTPIQNKDAFEFVDVLMEATDGAHYDSAGALGNGERIWCSAKVPFDFEPVPGDKTETYLMFTTSHDGSASAVCKLTTVRVVCQNTLSQAIGSAGQFVRVKHTRNAQDRMVRAAELMKGIGANVSSLKDKLVKLAQVKMTRESMKSILDRIFPESKDKEANTTRRENILADVLRLYERNDNNAFPEIRGTGYNLLNAVTEYTDHLRTAKNHGGNVLLARADSSTFGSGCMLKENALEVILQESAKLPSYIPASTGSSLLDSICDNTRRN